MENVSLFSNEKIRSFFENLTKIVACVRTASLQLDYIIFRDVIRRYVITAADWLLHPVETMCNVFLS